MTYGYIHCRFQTLTSHRSSLSFLFGFHDVTMMFMSLCNELTVCLYHPLLLGSEQSNLHGERHKSMKDIKHEMAPPFRVLLFAPHKKKKKTKMCSNWSPWQEFETLPCLLLVDIVVLMSSSVETRPLIPCHPLSPPFFTASTADSWA